MEKKPELNSNSRTPRNPMFVGRKNELEILKKYLQSTLKGEGRLVLITGEAGVGKTALLEEFQKSVREIEGIFLKGQCLYNTGGDPYLPFLDAIKGYFRRPKTSDAEMHLPESSDNLREDMMWFSSHCLLLKNTRYRPERDGEKPRHAGYLISKTRSRYEKEAEREDEDDGEKVQKEDDRNALAGSSAESKVNVNSASDGATEEKDRQDIDTSEGIDRKENKENKEDDREEYSSGDEQICEDRLLNILEASKEKEKIFETLMQLIENLAKRKPVFIAIEDIQWADSGTLQLLFYIAKSISGLPIMLIGTYRPEELYSTGKRANYLIELLKRNASERIYTTLHLNRLTIDENTELIERWQKQVNRAVNINSEHHLPRDFAEQIYSITEGNPFFTVEILEMLHGDRIFEKPPEEWAESISPRSLPASLKDLVSRRVDKIEPDHQKILTYAAVLGRSFSFKDLHAISGMDEESLLDILETLAESKLIVESDPDNEIFSFDHSLTREVVYNTLTRTKQKVLHRKVAEYLESRMSGLNGTQPHPEVYKLAEHYFAAGIHDKALYYNIKAGERALRNYSPETALLYYENALSSVEQAELAGGEINRLLLELYLHTGDIHQMLVNWDKAISSFEKAVSAAHSLDNKLLEAHALRRLGEVYSYRSEWKSALEHLEKAQNISSGLQDKSEYAWSTRMIGWCYLKQGVFKEAKRYLESAMTIATEQGNISCAAQAVIDLGNMYNDLGELATAYKYYSEVRELLKSRNDNMDILARALNNLADIHIKKGEIEDAMKLLHECIAVSKKASSIRILSYAYANMGECYLSLNRLKEAEDFIKKGLALTKRTGEGFLTAVLQKEYGILFWKKMMYDEALHSFRDSATMLEKLDIPLTQAETLIWLGRLYLDMEKRQNAFETFEHAKKIALEIGAINIVSEADYYLNSLGDANSTAE